jgi:hypothetical protein
VRMAGERPDFETPVRERTYSSQGNRRFRLPPYRGLIPHDMRRSAAKAMRADIGDGATFQVAGNITGALVKVAHRPDPEDDYRSEDQSTETGKKRWHLLRISPKALVEK